MSLKKKFKEVGQQGGIEFRDAPFWSWNDKLTPQEVKRQAKEMKEKGLGGYFMHSRVGLDVPYMGKQWMDCIRACVEQGKKIGIKSWLYDEDKWASGFVSGLVSGLGGEYNPHRLDMREFQVDWNKRGFVPQDRSLRAYLVKKEKNRLSNLKDVTGIPLNLSCHRGDTIIEIFVERLNDYVDLLNPKVVEEFINKQYEPYRKHFGPEFGKNIPGIFTDEPNYAGPLPWNERIPSYFKERFGYDLEDNLLSLFYEIGDWKRVRRDYYLAVTELFATTFTKRMYEWCQTYNLKFTGHFLAEDNLKRQTNVIGAAMPHYRWMQIPGIDHLSRRITDPILVKQVSSVAHQFGGRRVLSEMFGCSGWNMTFEDQRWIGQWQFVLGVDLPCRHLYLYTLRGCRKRDYPPSFNDHQPWWPYLKLVNDRFARALFMLTQGKHYCDVLVIHPIESYWSVMHPYQDRSEEEMWLEDGLLALTENLCSLHFDYDFADEGIMEDCGWVKGQQIGIETASYKLVIVPPGITLRSSTLNYLRKFAANGGKVVALEPLPTRLDGKEDKKIKELKNISTVIENKKNLLQAKLSKFLNPEIRILEPKDQGEAIYYQERVLEDNKKVFFLANISPDKTYKNVKVQLRGRGGVQEADADTGEIRDLPAVQRGEYVEVQKDLVPTDSTILLLDEKLSPKKGAPEKWKITDTRVLGDNWSLQIENLNALTLDYCDYRIDQGSWQKNIPVIKLYNQLFQNFVPAELDIRYSFKLKGNPKKLKELYLISETPENFKIKVNGQSLKKKPSGWWIDRAFSKIDIKGQVKPGENVVEMSCDYRPPMEVESCYLAGTFQATKAGDSFNLSPDLPDKASYGNLVEKGLPFYAGAVTYCQKFNYKKKGEKVCLVLDKLDAIVADLRLNGKKAGVIVWRPWELDISSLIKEGENQLEIKLVSSLRNLLGPHHLKEVDPISVGPYSFPQIQTDKYSFVPFGLTKPAKIVSKTRRGR